MLTKSSKVKKVTRRIKVAIVVAEFNRTITAGLERGSRHALHEAGITDRDVVAVHVPGSVEIPLAAELLAGSRRYAAIICLGAVIKGETNHDVYVSRIAADGIRSVMLRHRLPVAFGVLTCKTPAQAKARSGPNRHNRGYEAARAALEMVDVVAALRYNSSAIKKRSIIKFQ